MNIPNLPTDNLYKFIALTGVAIFILTLYATVTMVNKYEDAVLDTKESENILHIKVEVLSEEIKTVNEIINNSILMQNKKYKPDPNKLDVTYSNQELKELMKDLHEKSMLQSIELEKANSLNIKSEILGNRVKLIIRYSTVIMIIGSIIAFLGFCLWYIKVQKPMDENLVK